jgi:uncharacterized protein YrzB (UPF0473 family)
MSENENNIIYLTDDDGNRECYEVLDLVEYDGCEYIVLYPIDPEVEDDGNVIIFQLEDLNAEEDAYIPVEDEETLQAVFEIFQANYEEE